MPHNFKWLSLEPKSWKRPGGRSHRYTENDIRKYQQDIAFLCKPRFQRMEGPVHLEIEFLLPRPKKLMRKKDPDGAISHDKKPDSDNLEKALIDAISGIVYGDDRQIYSHYVTKHYHSKTGSPGIMLTAATENEVTNCPCCGKLGIKKGFYKGKKRQIDDDAFFSAYDVCDNCCVITDLTYHSLRKKWLCESCFEG